MDGGAQRVLPGLMLAMLLGALDQTAMTSALPAVAADLGRFDLMPAVLTAYLAAATVVMPLYGKLGDRFGRKPLLLAAIGVFVAGALLCATATSMSA
ncbi:MAG TPA: MFS transporter, partial [Pseudonocardia sp.]|nr:MFS transporter [Pseudonocardia sp.]